MSALNSLLDVDAAFRQELAGGEPTFEVRVDGDLQGTFTRSKILEGNEAEFDLCAWVTKAAVHEEFISGGGAATAYVVRRIA